MRNTSTVTGVALAASLLLLIVDGGGAIVGSGCRRGTVASGSGSAAPRSGVAAVPTLFDRSRTIMVAGTPEWPVLPVSSCAGDLDALLDENGLDGRYIVWIDSDCTLSDSRTTGPGVSYWVTPGYRVFGDGNSVWTVDSPSNVQAGDRQQVVAPTILLRFKRGGMISPAWYGAVGNGTTDDTAALQAAIDAAGAATACTVRIPGGTYVVSDPLRLSSVTVEGDGDATILQPKSSTSCVVEMNGTMCQETGTFYSTRLSNLRIDGSGTLSKTGICIGTTPTTARYSLDDVTVHDFKGPGATAVKIADSVWCTIQRCNLADNQRGMLIGGFGTNPTTTRVRDTSIGGSLEEGVLVTSAWGLTFDGCIFEGSRREGLKVAPAAGQHAMLISICHCHFEANHYDQEGRTSRYALTVDGSLGATSVQVDDVIFGIMPDTEKAIDLNKVYSATLNAVEVRNVAHAIRVRNAASNVSFISYPSDTGNPATVLANPDRANVISVPDMWSQTASWPPAAAWTSWTPAVTGFATMDVGSVVVSCARYKKIGKTVIVTVNLSFTAGGTPAAGITISPPPGAVPAGIDSYSSAIIRDVDEVAGSVQTGASDGFYVRKLGGANYGKGPGRQIQFTLTYETQ